MSILIVDDSLDNLILLKAILEAEGYTDVLTATSAREAFKYLGMGDEMKCDRMRVDVVLMDIMMPDMDGIEACGIIKATEHLKDIPVIMVTAKTEDNDLQLAFAAGAIDYITKPLNKVELLARLRSVLKMKHEMDRRRAREKELQEVTRLLEQANRTLQRLSSLDDLTGIHNRRRFDEFLELEWRKALTAATPLSLIMADIDAFKAYNDTYGHLSGDEALKQVAGALSSSLYRPSDVVARYGGEEFAIILSETIASGAAVVAERMRVSVEALEIKHAKSPVCDRLTVSFGVATMVPNHSSFSKDLIAAADDALFQAKRAGGNNVKIENNKQK